MGIKAKGGVLMVGYHKSSAPLSLDPRGLEIHVDLTPIKFVAGHQLNDLYKRSVWQAQGLSLVGLTVGASE